MCNDIIYSLRALRRSPGLSAVVIVSLGLGIGANTAVFSLLHQVVFQSLPIRNPEALVVLHRDYSPPGAGYSDNSESVFSYPMYRDLRDRNPAFADAIARTSAPVRVRYGGVVSSARAELVSSNYFSALGIGAAAGRLFAPAHDSSPLSAPSVVLSHAYWNSQFAESLSIIDQALVVNDVPFIVVGVAGVGFKGLIQGTTPDIFVPVAMQRSIIPAFDALEDRSIRWLNLFARLRVGEDLRHAQATTDVVYDAVLATEFFSGGSSRGDRRRSRESFLNHRLELRPAVRGLSALRQKWESPLKILMSMAGLVLLIACGNVAGLLMARAKARQPEIALRLALGANRRAICQQLFIEGLMLATSGGVAGVVVAQWFTNALLRVLPARAFGNWLTAEWNLSLLGFAVMLSSVCALLFALLPAAQATSPDLAVALKSQAGIISSRGLGSRFGEGFVVLQIAVSTLLLVGACTFSMSAWNLLNAHLGFRSDRLLLVPVNAVIGRPRLAATFVFYRDLQERLSSLPEVSGVCFAIGGPLSGSVHTSEVTIEGYQPSQNESVRASVVPTSPDFFRVMGIEIRAGREFSVRDDAGSPKVVVVNETFARRFFGQRNPIGKRLRFGGSREIVGVVADSRSDPKAPDTEVVYQPYMQREKPERMVYYVRIAGDEKRLGL